jgi:hypothetical protein
MNHRTLASLVSLLLAGSAYASPSTPSYAVLSLVGDKIDIVTYQPQVGSQLDNNSHQSLVMSQDDLDTVALRAVNSALRATVAGADVVLLAASTPDSFDNQAHMFSGDHVTLPAEIDAAVRREGATTLVLLTKRRAEASLKVQDGHMAGGKLEGLGFYVDANKHMKNRETGVRSIGFLAPFVYVDLSLIDVATGTVMRRGAITVSQTIGTANHAEGASPWDALTTQEKVSALKGMLSSELATAIPALLAPGATTATAQR